MKKKKIIKNIKAKPAKRSDSELYEMIEESIKAVKYLLLSHANQRARERAILDIDVISILLNDKNRNRKRNKKKDSYEEGQLDWKYCIEGNELDDQSETPKGKLRIIVTFDLNLMLIITLIRL